MDEQKKNKINPWRVLGKGLVIFFILNLIIALANPPMRLFVLFNNGIFPGYQRLPVLWTPDRHLNNSQFFERSFIDKIDLMLAAHVISSKPKGANEYRVLIYGDSSVWGTALFPNETLAGQLNSMNLTTCDGKKIVSYNLGYPSNAALKDLVIMDQTRKYQPDISIWLFSMLAFTQARQIVPFVEANPIYSRNIINKYNLKIDTSTLPQTTQSVWEKSIIGKRQEFHLLVNLYASRIITAAIGTDDPRTESEREIILTDTPTKSMDFYGIVPSDNLGVKLALDTLPAADKITDGKIIYVNEPIYTVVPTGDQVGYNSAFPVWAYDKYRSLLADMAEKNHWQFYDYWDLLKSADNFSTSIFHLRPAAEAVLAEKMSAIILSQSCPQN